MFEKIILLLSTLGVLAACIWLDNTIPEPYPESIHQGSELTEIEKLLMNN